MLAASFDSYFHNIGQGLFYSSSLNFFYPIYMWVRCSRRDYIRRPKNFVFKQINIVYDCGTEKDQQNLYNSIEQFAYQTNKELHLLVISHFHKDHISGLERLLNSFKRKYIAVIPYFHPLERLLFYLLNPRMPDWYLDFLKDPAKFLREKGFSNIFIIFGDEGRPPDEQPDDHNIPPNEPFPPDGDFYLPLDDIEGTLKLVDKLKGFSKKYLIRHYEEKLNKNGNNGKFKNIILQSLKNDLENLQQNASLKIDWGFLSFNFLCPECKSTVPIWLFSFYNYHYWEGIMFLLRNERFQKLLEKVNGDIWQIIENSNYRNQLRQIYNYLVKSTNLKEFNNSSLTMLHTPYNYKEQDLFSLKGDLRFIYCIRYLKYIFPFEKTLGHFLTGDINLNFDKFNEFIKHFGKLKENVNIGLIPHHGSQYNWNNEILLNLPKCFWWIASAGLKNKYGHPHENVFENIGSLGRYPLWCNELNPVNFKTYIYWDLLKIC